MATERFLLKNTAHLSVKLIVFIEINTILHEGKKRKEIDIKRSVPNDHEDGRKFSKPERQNNN